MSTKSNFVKVRCNDCENEQVIFDRASTPVVCHICSTTLAEPAGGKAIIKGQIIKKLE